MIQILNQYVSTIGYSLSTAIVKKHLLLTNHFQNYILWYQVLIQILDLYFSNIGYINMKNSLLYSLSIAIVKKHFAVDKPFLKLDYMV